MQRWIFNVVKPYLGLSEILGMRFWQNDLSGCRVRRNRIPQAQGLLAKTQFTDLFVGQHFLHLDKQRVFHQMQLLMPHRAVHPYRQNTAGQMGRFGVLGYAVANSPMPLTVELHTLAAWMVKKGASDTLHKVGHGYQLFESENFIHTEILTLFYRSGY